MTAYLQENARGGRGPDVSLARECVSCPCAAATRARGHDCICVGGGDACGYLSFDMYMRWTRSWTEVGWKFNG